MLLLGNKIGAGQKPFFIAGPCVIESRDMAMRTAEEIAVVAQRQNCLIVYKSSFDKANRTSGASYRGPGFDEGLQILADVKAQTGLPVLTDVHEPWQAATVAEVVDVMQTPAFLARQTDFIEAVCKAGKPVNIKKGQFMAPADMAQVVQKAFAVNNPDIMVCERGTSFGYNNLVVDMRGIAVMADIGRPVVFDATHSTQHPGGLGNRSGGQREYVPVLARAAIAAGAHGVFLETHPDPDKALCDAATQWPLDKLEHLIGQLVRIAGVTN